MSENATLMNFSVSLSPAGEVVLQYDSVAAQALFEVLNSAYPEEESVVDIMQSYSYVKGYMDELNNYLTKFYGGDDGLQQSEEQDTEGEGVAPDGEDGSDNRSG